MIEHIRQYYADEKIGSVYALIAGLVFLVISVLLWIKFSTNPLSKGLATGFIVVGILLLIISVSTFLYNNKKIENTNAMRSVHEITLQQNEITRMDKVMNVTFKYAFITFGLLVLAAFAIILLSKNYYWKGIGISLLLLTTLIIISDSFSMQRNAAYQQTIIDISK